MSLQADDKIGQGFAYEPSRTLPSGKRLLGASKGFVNLIAAPDESTGCVWNAAQLVNFKDCKFAENTVSHQRLVTINGVLVVPCQWVGFGEPI